MALDPNEPVDLDAAKLHVKAETDADDTLIEGLVLAARRRIENHTGHILLKREMTKPFASFETVRLREYPIDAAADVTVVYRDADDAEQTLTGYRLTTARPAKLVSTADWPEVIEAGDAVAVTFTAGYDAPDDVPADLKAAMLLLIGDWYRNREDTGRSAAAPLPTGVLWICKDYRLPGMA